MRKTKHVWEKITDLDNIRLAIARASEKKRHRRIVQKVLSNIDAYALEIQRMLLEKSFVPTPYIPVTIRDGASQKTRTIHKPAFFPDQIVHWALTLPAGAVEEVDLPVLVRIHTRARSASGRDRHEALAGQRPQGYEILL